MTSEYQSSSFPSPFSLSFSLSLPFPLFLYFLYFLYFHLHFPLSLLLLSIFNLQYNLFFPVCSSSDTIPPPFPLSLPPPPPPYPLLPASLLPFWLSSSRLPGPSMGELSPFGTGLTTYTSPLLGCVQWSSMTYPILDGKTKQTETTYINSTKKRGGGGQEGRRIHKIISMG